MCAGSAPRPRATSVSSRVPRPPVRSSRCGSSSIRCTTSSRSCSRPKAAPAAARSIRVGSRRRPVTSGGSLDTGSAVNRRPRSCQDTSRGMSTVSESRGRSSSRASSSSTGDRAAAAETTRSALRTAPVGDHSNRSSTARASALHSATARSIWAGGERPGGRWREPARVGLEGLPDRTDQVQLVVVAPDQSAGPKIAYGSRPRWTAGGRAARPRRRSSSGRAARPAPSATTRRQASSWSSAQPIEDPLVERAASAARSRGGGRPRSGRARSSSVRASSSQVRRDSARVRGRDFESTALPPGGSGGGRRVALRP